MKDIFMTIVLIIGIVISLTFAAFETFSADCEIGRASCRERV